MMEGNKMDVYAKGLSLLYQAQYKLAYEEFSKLIQIDERDYQAYYYRGIIDFYYLKDHLDQTVTDFKKVIDNTPETKELYAPLAILSDDIDDTIYYGERALTDPLNKSQDILMELYYALSRAYFLRGTSTLDYLKALNYIENSLTYTDDGLNIYLSKCEILLGMELYDEILPIIDMIITKYEFDPMIYFIKGRTLSKKPQSFESNALYHERLEEAIHCFNVYKRYHEDDISIDFYLGNALKLMGRFNEALAIFNQLLAKENLEDFITEAELYIEIITTYEKMGNLTAAFNFASHHLDLWQVELTKLIISLNHNKENFNEFSEQIKKLYFKVQEGPIAMTLLDKYIRNGAYQQAELFLNEIIKLNPNDGRWDYYLSDILSKLNRPDKEIVNVLTNAFEKGYISYLEYSDLLYIIHDKPSVNNRFFKTTANIFNKAWHNDLNLLEISSAQKISLRYLYGLSGFKINLTLALKYASFCRRFFPDDCCMNINYGRVLEFSGKHDEAFKYYHYAYQLTSKEEQPLCYCSYGYYAHALIKGIGTSIDENKAKSLILEAIKQRQERSDSSVLSLYAYFALKEEDGFDLVKATKYLLAGTTFLKYELTRYQLLKNLYQKQNLKIDKEIIKMLKLSKRFDSLRAKAYFKKHKKDKIYYPFFNHY